MLCVCSLLSCMLYIYEYDYGCRFEYSVTFVRKNTSWNHLLEIIVRDS